jgi:putative phosphoesterase
VRIGLISDTHGQLRPGVLETFKDVELILHAGDVGGEDILVELESIAPVHAVLGNTDGFPLVGRLPEIETLELEARRIVVVHGHQVGSPTPGRLRAAHPDADIIIYGHTHQPLIDHADSSLVVNPGAAGPARFKLKPSVALLELVRGHREQVTIVDL